MVDGKTMSDNSYVGKVKYVFLGSITKEITVEMPVDIEFEGKTHEASLTWNLPVDGCTYEVGDKVAIAWKKHE